MRTFQGRKTKGGVWVAAGQRAELIMAMAMEEEVQVVLPKRAVVTRIVRVGQGFAWVTDEPEWAYGYPARPIPNVPRKPLHRRSRPVRPAVAPAPEQDREAVAVAAMEDPTLF